MKNLTVFDLANNWLFEQAFPFWGTSGIDRTYGGFVEALRLDGSDAEMPYKRTRVTARQIYCFAQAELLGWHGGKELVLHGLNHLIEKSWLGEERGFARKVSRDGMHVLDDTPDLYDYAFVLFAFAWAYRATKLEQLRDWANKTLDCMEQLLKDNEGEGFWNDGTKLGWRQQNPHMHLLEAALSSYEAFGSDRFRSLSIDVLTLFQNRLFQRGWGFVPEFFDNYWNVAEGTDGEVVEPGHQFEWAWILANCERLLGVATRDEVSSLVKVASIAGVQGQSGLVIACVKVDGSILDNSFRTWPNSERLKAACALHDLFQADPLPMFQQSTKALFDYHLSSQIAGTWIDLFDSELRPTSKLIPASSMYHLVLGFSEMLRVGRKLEAGEKNHTS